MKRLGTWFYGREFRALSQNEQCSLRKVYSSFQLSDRIPEENFYKRLKFG
jgi:hypothetical protein